MVAAAITTGSTVGTQQHRRPVTVAQHPGDPGLPDALEHLEAETLQPARHDPRGAVLGERQLRMGVQIPIDAAKAVVQLVSHGTEHSPGRRWPRLTRRG
jgi:hypothetical protein